MNKNNKTQKRTDRIYFIFTLLVYTFIYIPIVIIIIFSFNDQPKNTYWNGFTTIWWSELFRDTKLWGIVMNTLIISVVSTISASIIGTIGAVGMVRHDFKGKRFLNSAIYIPIIIPEIVLAVALLCIYTKFGIPLGKATIIFGHITLTVPFIVINVKARLAGYDKSLEEAAMDLGANRIQTFFKIILPMIMPGILSGALLAFTLSLDDLVISNFVTGIKSTTLPVEILGMLRSGISPEINALTTIIMTIITLIYICIIILLTKIRRKGECL